MLLIGTVLYLQYPETFGGIYKFQLDVMDAAGPLAIPLDLILTCLGTVGITTALLYINSKVSLKGRVDYDNNEARSQIDTVARNAFPPPYK